MTKATTHVPTIESIRFLLADTVIALVAVATVFAVRPAWAGSATAGARPGPDAWVAAGDGSSEVAWPAPGEAIVKRLPGGRLEVRALAAPAQRVLDALARQTGVSVKGPVPSMPPITCSLHRLSLERVLARIFRDVPYALVYDARGGKSGRAAELVLYAVGTGARPVGVVPSAPPIAARETVAATGGSKGRMPPDAEAAAALRALSDRHGNEWVAQWDGKTGLPSSMYGSTGSLGSTPQEAANRFLQQNTALFKLSPDLAGLKVASVLNYGGRARVEFARTVNGIPVVGATISLDVDESGAVWDAQAGPPPAAAPPPDQRVGQEAAIKAALDSAGGGKGYSDPRAELSYVTGGGGGAMTLVWRVKMTSDDDGSTLAIDVDAGDGHVVSSQKLDD